LIGLQIWLPGSHLGKTLFWVVGECIVFAVARFVTIKAIALKLMYHKVRVSQTKFQSSLILGLATRGPKPKT
jgi:hypothetical protein